MIRIETRSMVISLCGGLVLTPPPLRPIPDTIRPVSATYFDHVPAHRSRARPAGAAAVRRNPHGGRTRRPARRRRAHGPPLRGPPGRPGRAGRVGARPLRRVPAGFRLPDAAADADRR